MNPGSDVIADASLPEPVLEQEINWAKGKYVRGEITLEQLERWLDMFLKEDQ